MTEGMFQFFSRTDTLFRIPPRRGFYSGSARCRRQTHRSPNQTLHPLMAPENQNNGCFIPILVLIFAVFRIAHDSQFLRRSWGIRHAASPCSISRSYPIDALLAGNRRRRGHRDGRAIRNGIWDSYHNKPLIRRGITAGDAPKACPSATASQCFSIDCALNFPGSSGSPVLLYNRGSYATPQAFTWLGNGALSCSVFSTRSTAHHRRQCSYVVTIPTIQVPTGSIGSIPNHLRPMS